MAPVVASADVVTFFVSGTFDDGGTFAGTFQLDRTSASIRSYGLASTRGSVFEGFIYDARQPFPAMANILSGGCGVLQFSFGLPGQSIFIIAFPAVPVATFDGGAIVNFCADVHVPPPALTSFEQRLPLTSMVRSVTGGQAVAVGSETGLSLTASANPLGAMVGQTVTTSASVNNPGLEGSADLYLGALLPDGVTIVFWTGESSLALGSLTDTSTFRPYAAGVSLAMSFVRNMPDFFSHQRIGSDPHGAYLLFNLATRAGAVAGGTLTSTDVLGLTTTAFVFP